MPEMVQQSKLSRDRIISTSRHHQGALLDSLLVVKKLHFLHEFRLASDVQVIDTGFDTSVDDRGTIETIRADTIEQEFGAATHGEQGSRVIDMGLKQGQGRRGLWRRSPCEGSCELGG